jgi:hypothetical protein
VTDGTPRPTKPRYGDDDGDICPTCRQTVGPPSPAPAGPTPDDMADIMQAATGGPDFTIKDWPPAPAVLDGQPRTPEGIALWHRGSANWSEGDWYAKFGASIRAVEDAARASSPAPAGLDVEDWLDIEDALHVAATSVNEMQVNRDRWTELRDRLRAATRPAGDGEK